MALTPKARTTKTRRQSHSSSLKKRTELSMKQVIMTRLTSAKTMDPCSSCFPTSFSDGATGDLFNPYDND